MRQVPISCFTIVICIVSRGTSYYGKENKMIKTIKRYFEKEYEILTTQHFIYKFLKFIPISLNDLRLKIKDNSFREYGMTTFVGRQGSGKTISLCEKLEQYRKKYPQVYIMTNFGYIHQDEPLNDWQQLIDKRSEHGIIFAIDEIQNEFDVYESRNFNLEILKVITQQRKQGIKILATSQVFTRVSKPLREQTYEIIECYTVAGRWTFQKCFDAEEYNVFIDNVDMNKKFKVRRKWRKNFIQTDKIRTLFDSYSVIESMKKLVRKK